jgi:hypothetical protein
MVHRRQYGHVWRESTAHKPAQLPTGVRAIGSSNVVMLLIVTLLIVIAIVRIVDIRKEL